MKTCPLCHGRIIILKKNDCLVLICQNYDGVDDHYGEVVPQKEELSIQEGA